jgi:hypothetical protein
VALPWAPKLPPHDIFFEKGENTFADLAKRCAVGEDQKAEFETTARFIFSTAVLDV